jgi:parallel beta-helix repeat protein
MLSSPSKNNTITHNSISHNTIGIIINHCSNNLIAKNNFQSNSMDAIFIFNYGYHINNLPDELPKKQTNQWTQNYWGRPRLLPKLIKGGVIITIARGGFGNPKLPIIIPIPQFQYDLNPAIKPNDIR